MQLLVSEIQLFFLSSVIYFHQPYCAFKNANANKVNKLVTKRMQKVYEVNKKVYNIIRVDKSVTVKEKLE